MERRVLPSIVVDQNPSRLLDVTFGKKPQPARKLPQLRRSDWRKDYKTIVNEPTTVTEVQLNKQMSQSPSIQNFRSGLLSERISSLERHANDVTVNPVKAGIIKLEN